MRRNLVDISGHMVEGKPKTERSARTFGMLPQAVEDLRRQKAQQAQDRLLAGDRWEGQGLVFAATNGHPLHSNNVGRAFIRIRERANRAACVAAGKDPMTATVIRALPPYSLRHAAASILLARTENVAVAAKMMGHSMEMFTETYAELLLEASREVAAKAGAFLAEHTPQMVENPAVVTIQRGGRRRTKGSA